MFLQNFSSYYIQNYVNHFHRAQCEYYVLIYIREKYYVLIYIMYLFISIFLKDKHYYCKVYIKCFIILYVKTKNIFI
jgi:hypothetical protein